MRWFDVGRQNLWIPEIPENCEAEIPIKKRSTSPSKHTQFPVMLAWVSTVHNIQALNLEQGVIDFDLLKQKWFGLNRVKTHNNL